jgi:hypothetical protein
VFEKIDRLVALGLHRHVGPPVACLSD